MSSFDLIEERPLLHVGRFALRGSDLRKALLYCTPITIALLVVAAICAYNYYEAQTAMETARLAAAQATAQARRTAADIDQLRIKEEKISQLTSDFYRTRLTLVSNFAPLVQLNNTLSNNVPLLTATWAGSVISLHGQTKSYAALRQAQQNLVKHNIAFHVTNVTFANGILTWNATLPMIATLPPVPETGNLNAVGTPHRSPQ